jgi:hypothetical protein
MPVVCLIGMAGILSFEGSQFRARDLCDSRINQKTKGFNKLAPFLQSQKCFAGSYFARARERGATVKSGYDLHSAITFSMVGLGIGLALAILFRPKQRIAPEGLEGIDGWHTAGSQPPRPQEEAKKRIG